MLPGALQADKQNRLKIYGFTMFYNEESGLPLVCSSIADWQAHGEYGRNLEAWRLVDDGSVDSSLGIAQDYCTRHSFFKLVSLKENFGKGWAFRQGAEDLPKKGIDSAVIVQLDADLGNLQPEDIDALVRKLLERVSLGGYSGPRVASIALVPSPYENVRSVRRAWSSFWAKRNLAISGQRAYFGYTLHSALPRLQLGTGYGLEQVINQSLIERFLYLKAKYGIKQEQRKELIGVISWDNVQHQPYKEKRHLGHDKARKHPFRKTHAFIAGQAHYIKVAAESAAGLVKSLPRKLGRGTQYIKVIDDGRGKSNRKQKKY
jgi:glycosyltransferase involved in cell wall biosynthesis